MDIDKRYYLESRIKMWNGQREMVINNEEGTTESLEDIDAIIEALTNLLEMI